MANGDNAAAAGMDVVSGTTADRRLGYDEINKTRDYIVSFFNSCLASAKAYTDAKFGAISLTWAAITGKPATFPPSGHTHTAQDITPGTGYFGGGTTYGFPTDVAANGSFYSFGRSNVVSSYVAAYFNGDGRLGTSPSALKYKRDVEDYAGSVLGLRAVTYVLKDDERETRRLGVIADEANDIEPMLVVHEDDEVEGFKYELLAVGLLVEVQRLAAEVAALKERIPNHES